MKIYRNLFFSVFLSGLIFVFGCRGALAEDASDSGSGAVTLTAEIEHAQELEPLSPQLEAGSTFNQAAIEKRFTPNDYWYRIPNWLGGIWQRNEQNMLRQKSLTLTDKLKTSFLYAPKLGLFKSQVIYRWGHQYDRLGQIWNYARFPYTSTIKGSAFYTVQVVRKATPIKVNNKVVILKFIDSSHRVDYRTNRIISSQQSESISMYKLFKPNVIYARFSRKEFNSKGKAKFIQESESYIPRIKNFYPENFKDGKDLRISLRHYLLAHYPMLAPDSTTAYNNRNYQMNDFNRQANHLMNPAPNVPPYAKQLQQPYPSRSNAPYPVIRRSGQN